MSDNYVILDDITDRDDSENIQAIIEKYVENKNNYADPKICKNERTIGKAYIPEDNLTLFWVVHTGQKCFFDAQKGRQ